MSHEFPCGAVHTQRDLHPPPGVAKSRTACRYWFHTQNIKFAGNGPTGRKPMQRTTPPFRADHVGSLLRPPAVKEARASRERNEITADALRAIEDREIERVDQKTGRDRAQAGDRRRIPPHLVALRFLPRSRRRRASTSPITASSFTACRPRRTRSRSTARSAFPAIRCWSISGFSRRTPASRRK